MLLLVILLVGFAAWHSGTNLLYLIFSILVSFYLVHGFVLSVNLHSLSVMETIPETVITNQPFDMTAVISNNKRWVPSYAIRLKFSADSPSAALGSIFYPIGPREVSREAACMARFPQRGLHIITNLSISTRYPFGFEERAQIRKIDKQILALPPTYEVSAIAASIPFGFGDQPSSVRGAGTDLYGLREYVDGEHARHVHWRTSARMQKLMIAEYSRDERRQVTLLLNNSLSTDWHITVHSEFENSVIFTASLARHLIDSGFEVGLVTADAAIPVAQGTTHLLTIMRHLAIVSLVQPRPLPKLKETVLQILFHSHSSSNEAASRWLTIDSRSWSPPQDQIRSGENTI